jgi:RNA polymerase sigma factor (sigma-70 family)
LTAIDEAGWADQFEAQRHALLRHCTRLVGADEAQDVVQDTYLKAARHASSMRNPSAMRAWLFRVASNRCVDLHRRRSRLVALGDRDPAGSAGRDVALRQMVERLAPRERAIVVMYYSHGYGLGEIAEKLGLTHTQHPLDPVPHAGTLARRPVGARRRGHRCGLRCGTASAAGGRWPARWASPGHSRS